MPGGEDGGSVPGGKVAGELPGIRPGGEPVDGGEVDAVGSGDGDEAGFGGIVSSNCKMKQSPRRACIT